MEQVNVIGSLLLPLQYEMYFRYNTTLTLRIKTGKLSDKDRTSLLNTFEYGKIHDRTFEQMSKLKKVEIYQ